MKKPVKNTTKRSLLTKAKRKRLNARSEKGTKDAGKYYVFCTVHGSRDKTSKYYQHLSAGHAKHKRQRMSGCPLCRRDKNAG